jgi:ribonuclease P protein component
LSAKEFELSQKKRLKTPAEFQAVFKQQPLRSKTIQFTVLATSNQREYARLGLIVAKRFERKAVHRNRARRLIRESFRHNQSILAGLDVVVLVRCGLSEQKTQVLYEQLEQQWQNLAKQWQKA